MNWTFRNEIVCVHIELQNQTFVSVLWIVHKLMQLLVCMYAEKIENWEEIFNTRSFTIWLKKEPLKAGKVIISCDTSVLIDPKS